MTGYTSDLPSVWDLNTSLGIEESRYNTIQYNTFRVCDVEMGCGLT